MLEEIIGFSKLAGKLKSTERTGWKTWAKIDDPESVADHTFRMAVLGMLFSDLRGMDTAKILRMILMHDMTEAEMGDWDYYAKKKLGIEAKRRRERECAEKMIAMLPEQLKERYSVLMNELLDEQSDDAKFVKQLDRMEMFLQTLEYEKEGKGEKMDAFWSFNKNDIKDKEMLEMFEMLQRERKKP